MDVVALDHENWAPLTPAEVKGLLDEVGLPWWIAGGGAIDLYLGSKTRHHGDTDVAILRIDQLAFQRQFHHWDLMIPTGSWSGEPEKSWALFRPWEPDEILEKGISQAWCRPDPGAAWAFEFLFAEGDSESWRFKRDETIALPLAEVTRTTQDGIPYLAPEVVLLHKATSSSPGVFADVDFNNVLPALNERQRAWLHNALGRINPEHKWITALNG